MGLLDSVGGFSGLTSGVGDLVGIGTDLYSAFGASAPKTGSGKFKGTALTPAFAFNSGTLTRRNSDFLEGARRLRGLYGTLRADLKPGFGQITSTGVNAIRTAAAQQAGNLRSQLGRRGLQGASFADDQLNRVESTYAQAEAEYRAQAYQAELAAQMQLLDREHASLAGQAAQELQELNLASTLIGQVQKVALSQKEIDKILAQEQMLSKLNEGAAPTPPPAPKPKKQKAKPAPANPFAGTPMVA